MQTPNQTKTPGNLHEYVRDVQGKYEDIKLREFDERNGDYRMYQSEMWAEAVTIVPNEWREIVRVLAQGGQRYSIRW